MGSSPTLRTSKQPANVNLNFGIYLLKKGNRESTIKRKLKYLKYLIGTPEEMTEQIFKKQWTDKVKSNALDVLVQYADFLKIHFHTFRHYAISWHYFKTKDIVLTQRFARHCNISNTLKYVHIVKSWIKSDNYNVVYAENKEELTNYLKEGYTLVTKTDWGYCLTKPKQL